MRRYKRSLSKRMKVKEYDFTGVLTPLAMRVNRQIESLNRKGYKKRSQAYKNLLARLDNNKIKAIDKKGKVKIFKNLDKLNTAQKRTLRTSLERFLGSQTSTKAGINKRDRNVVEGIRRMFKDDKIKLSDKQVNIMAEMFKNEDFNKLANKVGGSDILIITYDTIARGESKADLIENLKDYMIYDKANEKEILSILDMFDSLTR